MKETTKTTDRIFIRNDKRGVTFVGGRAGQTRHDFCRHIFCTQKRFKHFVSVYCECVFLKEKKDHPFKHPRVFLKVHWTLYKLHKNIFVLFMHRYFSR